MSGKNTSWNILAPILYKQVPGNVKASDQAFSDSVLKTSWA